MASGNEVVASEAKSPVGVGVGGSERGKEKKFRGFDAALRVEKEGEERRRLQTSKPLV